MYLDESGDLGLLGSKYFTVAVLCTKNPKPIENMMKRIKMRKLSKKLRNVSELKGNNSSPEIRKYVLENIAKQDCHLAIIVITKEQIVNRLFDSKHKLYNYVVGLLMKITDINGTDISIVIDKKENNKLLQSDLNQYIKKQIAERKLLFTISFEHKISQTDKCLQAVDFVAWSTNRKYSFEDDSYYRLIEFKITSFKKL
jgi:hypothetical protein